MRMTRTTRKREMGLDRMERRRRRRRRVCVTVRVVGIGPLTANSRVRIPTRW
jgi:hypothetical protein